MSVQRFHEPYMPWVDPHEDVMVPALDGEYVLFADHERALAELRMAAPVDRHPLLLDRYDAGWNAALDAAIKVVSSLGSCFECEHPQTALEALRKPPPQPEPRCSTCGHTDDDICHRPDCPA